MKFFGYLVMTLLWAHLQPALAESLQYEWAKETESWGPSDSYILQVYMSDRGFYALDQTHRLNLPYLAVSQVYLSSSQQQIFVLADVQVDPPKLDRQVIEIKDGWLFHGKFLTGKSFALFFRHFQRSTVERITHELSFAIKNTSQLITPSASLCAGNCHLVNHPITDTLSSTLPNINIDAITSTLTTCALTALEGVKEKVGEMATGAKAFLSQLFSNPRELWRQVAQRFDNFTKAVETVRLELPNLLAALAGVPLEMVKGLVCGVMGSLAPLLVRALSPAGIPQLIIAVTNAIRKLISNVESIKKIANLANLDVRGKTQLLGQVGLCAQ